MLIKIEEIKEILTEVLMSYFETQEIDEEVSNKTVLFGDGAKLDSMGLVNFIIDVESAFIDKDIEISLTSESAMSRRRSPFRDIETLAEFIYDQIEGSNE
jgi:acyl carrier protein